MDAVSAIARHRTLWVGQGGRTHHLSVGLANERAWTQRGPQQYCPVLLFTAEEE